MAQYTATYDGLVSKMSSYTEDNSSEFTAEVNGMINRAEERIIRDLDLSLFNVTLSTATSAGVSTYSKGWTDSPVISIHFTDEGVFAQRRTRAFIQGHGGTGVPLYFHENQSTIYWAPTPDDAYAYTLTYVQRPTRLSSSTQTNWLTQNVGDLLLWASLIEAEAFLIAPERVQEFKQSYAENLGPIRAFWREQAQNTYEPIAPTAEPVRTR
jgi:hypothetical protein